jgi:hypothetical protein
MTSFEFTDKTMRQRRNLLVIATLIIAIKFFDITITNVSISGVDLKGLTTNVVIIVLAGTLFYLATAYANGFYEEYNYWIFQKFDDLEESMDEIDPVGEMRIPILTTENQTRQFGEKIRLLQKQISTDTNLMGENELQIQQLEDLKDQYSVDKNSLKSISSYRILVFDIIIPSLLLFISITMSLT